jgi:hypothetical protein
VTEHTPAEEAAHDAAQAAAELDAYNTEEAHAAEAAAWEAELDRHEQARAEEQFVEHVLDRLGDLLADNMADETLYRLGVEDEDAPEFPIEAEAELDVTSSPAVRYVRLTVADTPFVAVLHAGPVPPTGARELRRLLAELVAALDDVDNRSRIDAPVNTSHVERLLAAREAARQALA